jgi:hypothetical protein
VSGVKITLYEYHRPFTNQKSTQAFAAFVAIDVDTKLDYGQHVRATEFSNLEYKMRFERLESRNNMKAPPGCENISSGYLVIGKPGTRKQFEDWMPDHKFDELYEKIRPEYVVYFPLPAIR